MLGDIVAFLFVLGVASTSSLIAATVARWRERRPGVETVAAGLGQAALTESLFYTAW